MVLKELGFEQKQPTVIHIDNQPALQMINHNTAPTECTRHCDICFFQIQDWREEKDLICQHI